ncbi:MAG: efflux RND transporter permease subunit [Bacteroidetes bacterium]|jgi:hydrophobic/amphiphilic exporter-1 (mainly G- bacteria), HAE1 family|nr:efflux RND transporter permease subunit [Bacteroidota bacterium]MBT4400267.1 efflux RND transporter permease subunit [Bacteroidota bacterium]MBT4411885.1 efflux RND transporter permease subunit [Bacteroidota bacterium]MBT5427749.1 efflux RND transporter permease subunit [Bacteroidota bacterium]MBT7092027.1 efflux RND transporter permease subunit [Bacteroidota bacterium]
MKKITQFSVNNPVTVTMLILGVLLLGFISFGKLGTDLMPEMNNPRIYVELSAGERPPEEIEKQFVDQIESLAIRQADVIGVSSVTRVGSAQITVEYSWDKDMDEAFLELQKALGSYNQNSDLDEILITQHDPNETPVLLVGMTHESIKDMNELRKVAENYIRNELIRLEGVADVKLEGQEVNEVVITTDPYRMEAFGVTTDIISGQIQNYNRNVSGGSIVEMGTQYIIKGVSVFEELEDMRKLIVSFQQAQTATEGETPERIPVFLSDVAKVEFENKEPINIVRINGERSIGLGIYKEPKFNTVKAVEELQLAFVDIEKALPGYSFQIIQDQGEFISNAIGEVETTALIGIILAVFILFIFLRRIGTTLIASIAIPISIVATFNLMYFNGLTINVMTLGGLALGAGMLVDNAIVVLENIFRNLEKGLSVKEAAIQGTAEVGGAITASTLTTIVVFLPIVYIQGASGELFKDQAWTVAFSLLSSLIVAILVIPMLFSKFIKVKKGRSMTKTVGFRWYPKMLNGLLRMKALIIIFAFALVAASALLLPKIGSEFMPKTETREFSMDLKLPEGTQIERTEQTVNTLDLMIKELLGDNLETLYARIGPASSASSSTAVFENENTANIKVMLIDETEISSSQTIRQLGKIVANMPDLEVKFLQNETALQATMGTDEAPIIVEVVGEEFELIEPITNQVREIMMKSTELFNVEGSFEEGAPEIEVVIDRFRAGVYGISVDQIIGQLQAVLTGADAGQFEHGGEMKDITIKLPDVRLSQLNDIVLTAGASELRLNDVATIRTVNAPKEIRRTNQNRVGQVSAQIRNIKPIDQVVTELNEQFAQLTLPPGYYIRHAGEELKRKESMGSLRFALLLSLILVYMVMASQFESLIHPFTIILTVPLAAVGTILLFFLMGQTLNIMALIGLIMLIGIAVNDSIILVDRINQLKLLGMKRKEAIVEAGHQRIRPILMTSLTTILALLPLTFGFGESASLRAPMALAVIGGLFTSTLLTLIVIPCVYDVLDKFKEWILPSRTQISEQL